MYTYHLHTSSNSQFFWHLLAGNGEKVAWSGETYPRKSDCLNGLNLFKRHCPTAPINDLTLPGAKPRIGAYEFEVYRDASGQHRWRFQASNNKIIAVSGESFATKRNCLDSIALVKQNAGTANIVDHTIAQQSVV